MSGAVLLSSLVQHEGRESPLHMLLILVVQKNKNIEFSAFRIPRKKSQSFFEDDLFHIGTNNQKNHSSFDPRSRMIQNDIPWNDNVDAIMETNKGSRLTRYLYHNNQQQQQQQQQQHQQQQQQQQQQTQEKEYVYYWLGTLPCGHILFYKSFTLGSSSWTLARRLKLDLPPHRQKNELGNCQLHHHPIHHTNHIFCKMRFWFIQTTEQNDNNNDPTTGRYDLLPIPNDPSNITNYTAGGQSTFQHNHTLYLVITRSQHHAPQSRKLFIYKLNPSWTKFDSSSSSNTNTTTPIIAQFPWHGRESPWIIYRQNLFYLFSSQTHGWQQSKTFYRCASTLEGLQYSNEYPVIMHPRNTKTVESMGSQFRFIIPAPPPLSKNSTTIASIVDNNLLNERWIFGGDRYPVEAPQYWNESYGRHVMVPMTFIDHVPHVYWKKDFDWSTYDYDSGDYDENEHERNGYAPTLATTPAIIPVTIPATTLTTTTTTE